MKNLPYLIGATALICGVAVIASADEGGMPDLNGAVAWLNSPIEQQGVAREGRAG